MTPRILVVEDDTSIATLVAKNLEAAGFEPIAVHDGARALDVFARESPDLVVLDLMLPGVDGLEITRRIRRESRVPILMLTARASEGDKVLGLEIGADDYVTKPFGTQELVARVRALLRRTIAGEQEASITCGALTIDPDRREATLDGRPITLTSLEFDVLSFMARRPGRVLSRDALMDAVWGEDRVVDARSIDSLVSRLRKKLARASAATDEPAYIQTVWGAGYRFRDR